MEKFNINKTVNPKGLKKDEYDAIIIGAGIGGLVCGCYLAKAGMKVLIVEQHSKVGGYCTSFVRGRFIFEAGSIEDLGEKSFFRKIVNELGIHKKINIIKSDPHIILFTPECNIKIRSEIKDTIKELQETFPRQAKEIRGFFKFIVDYNITSLYLKYRGTTFDELLAMYFTDERLKAIFRVLSSQIGVVSSKVSALSAVTYFKSFVVNGGYYPIGGLQKFSESFRERFEESGGSVKLSTLVEKIIIENRAKGIIVNKGDCFFGNYVISNADATQTFLKLVGAKHLKKSFISLIKNLIPSPSVFIVYLGLNKKIRDNLGYPHQFWDIPTYEEDDPFGEDRVKDKYSQFYLYCHCPSFKDPSMAPINCESISLSVFMPYLNKDYWTRNKTIFANKMIKRLAKIIPDVERYIAKKEIAMPSTLYRYTLNRSGAFKGWAPFLNQIDISVMPGKTSIENLYLVGHWVTTAAGEAGVPHAAYTGHRVANAILRRKAKG